LTATEILRYGTVKGEATEVGAEEKLLVDLAA